MGVTEKMIGSRLFINFCGKNLVDASLIQNVRICAENRVEVIQRDILQNGTVSIDRFDMPEAQAILDWMNAPTTEPTKDQLRQKLDSVTDEELIEIFEEIGASRGMTPPVHPSAKVSGTGCFAEAKTPRVGSPFFYSSGSEMLAHNIDRALPAVQQDNGFWFVQGLGEITYDELHELVRHRDAFGLKSFSKEHLETIRSINKKSS